jgi:hypothetical protein
MVLNFKKKKIYLRHEQSKVPARADLVDLGLIGGVFHNRVAGCVLVARVQNLQTHFRVELKR